MAESLQKEDVSGVATTEAEDRELAEWFERQANKDLVKTAKEKDRAVAAAVQQSALVPPIQDRAATPPLQGSLQDADLTFQGLNSTYQSSECGSEAPSEVS